MNRNIAFCLTLSALLVGALLIAFQQSPVEVQRRLEVGNAQQGNGISSMYYNGKNKLLFFNVKGQLATQNELPIQHYPKDGPAIAMLTSNTAKDVRELKVSLRSMKFLKGDKDPDHKAPILIFSEGDLTSGQVFSIISSTDRPVAFPLVDFTVFPKGFDPEKEEQPQFRVKDRLHLNPYGYYQMIRFWVTGIWKHPALQHFDTVMRIDTDSCFKDVNTYLPGFLHEGLDYHSQYVGLEDGADFVKGLHEDFVKDKYMHNEWWTRNNYQPQNYLLWHLIEKSWAQDKSLPVFRTNFEVSRKSFMLEPKVYKWHEALTEEEPFGIFRHRWGDAVTRFYTAALFTTEDRVLTIRPKGYYHKQGCSAEEVDEALLKLARSEAERVVPENVVPQQESSVA